jgi:hypothetical protein
VFYVDVAKVDRDVAHVEMAIHVCFKCMFQMFQTYVAILSFDIAKLDRDVAYIYIQVFQVFSYVCCKYFILMFVYVCNGYTRVFKFFLVFLHVF